MKQTQMLLFLVGIMRVLGVFPYHFSHQPATASFSWYLLILGLSLITSVWAILIVTQTMYLSMLVTVLHGTIHTVYMFMLFSLLIFTFLVPPYILLISRKLAKSLVSVLQLHDKQLGRFMESKLNKQTVFILFLILIFLVLMLIYSVSPSMPFVININSIIATIYDLPLRFIISLFYNAILRLLSLMLAASFTPLKKLYEKQISKSSFEDLQVVEVVPWHEDRITGEQLRYIHNHDRKTVIKEKTNKEQKFTEVYRKNSLNPDLITWGTLSSPSIQQETDALLFARSNLTVIEQLEATTTNLLAPIICLQLLLECILNVSYMISILPEDPKLILIQLFFLCVGELRVYLLLDAPEHYRKEVRARHNWIGLLKETEYLLHETKFL